MNHKLRFVSATAFAGAAIFLAIPLDAQVPDTPAEPADVSPGGEAQPVLKLADVESALDAIEKDAAIEDAVKDLLRPKYKQAIDALKEAADFAAQEAGYREAIKTAPDKAVEARDQLQALKSVEDAAKVTPTASSEDLQKDIDARRAALSTLSDDLSKAKGELARVKGRPVEISARLPKAQRELSESRKRLASPEMAEAATSPGRVADRTFLQAEESKLRTELEMLKQEQLSQSVREDLLLAQQELLTRQVENATATLDTLRELLDKQLTSDAASLADTIPKDVPEGDKEAQELATEVQALAKQFEDVVAKLTKVTAARSDIENRLESLANDYETIREQLKLGGGGGAMAQVLVNLRDRLLDVRADGFPALLPALSETRLAAIQVDTQLREQPDVEKKFADRSSDAVARLVSTRRDVLEKLRSQYGNLIRALAKFEADQRQYLDKAEEIDDYVVEQVFWLRSSPPLSAETLTNIPNGLRWSLQRNHWLELGRAVRWVATRMPVRSAGILLVVAVLLLMRRRISAALEKTAEKIRRISTDRYAHTIAALFWTFLLAVPIPLVIGFVGWAASQPPDPSDWLRDTAFSMSITAKVAMGILFLAAVCRPNGLGAAHFGWRHETLAPLRRALYLFAVVYLPALALTTSYHLYGDAADYFDSVGRIIFMLAHFWTAVVLWQLFRSADGILPMLIREHPTGVISRWRYVWFPLLIACPLALVILAAMGYLITATELSVGLVTTVALIAGGVILYALVLRWFMITQRKLALAEALERRRERQEAAAAEDHEESSGEIVSVNPEEEVALDLASIGEQTQALLALLFSLGTAAAIISFWSNTIRLFAILESIPVPLSGGLSLLGMVQAVLIAVVTFFAVRNLPGLLELGVLRTTTIDAGTRNAISKLCQYAVVAIGLVMLFNVLRVDWAKFGWIAAALSVGLGFGLQEVVANFVCGLILLFERPIRVGDVVTLEGTTGTVTNINMRATTITNWDRQEFVVPNKNLITGTILNWTLSAPLTRVVVPVGVAYGSDTEKARQILLEVAADHPRILDDPAPLATFEQFADSSLNLILRAYLPDLDNRIGTISELHTEIDKRFAAAGIEIAFPQRDLHLRSGWISTRQPGADGAENGKKEAASEQARQST